MNNPLTLNFSPKELSVDTIEQHYFTVDPSRKFELLLRLLVREKPTQCIIFCRTKRGTDKIQQRLAKKIPARDHDPRRPEPEPARPRDASVPRRQRALPRSHRRDRPRHRRHQRLAHCELRYPHVLRRLRASRGTHRPHGPRRSRVHVRNARRRARANADRRADQPAVNSRRDEEFSGRVRRRHDRHATAAVWRRQFRE